MKKHCSLLFVIFMMVLPSLIQGQAPQSFNYQAVCRDNNGNIMAGQSVEIRFSIYDLSPTGNILYSESHSLITNSYGLINVAVGSGTLISGTFATIPWQTGAKYLGVELNSGSGYVTFGTPQLLSVPYALYANTSASGATGATGATGAAGPAGCTTQNVLLKGYDATTATCTQAPIFESSTAPYNTGIGTLNPICKLDVNGAVNATNLPFNVKAYGARGDGSMNYADIIAETNAVHAALMAWLTAAAAGHGATLYFPAGTYVIDTWAAGLVGIENSTNLTICGDGMGASVIKAKQVSVVMAVLSTSSHVNLHDLTIDGSATTRTAGQHALIFDASYSTIRNVEIVNSGQFSMAIGQNNTHSQVTDITVEGCHVRNGFADGINLGYVNQGIISGNLIDGADDDCIAVGCNYLGYNYFSTNIVVTGNVCHARNDLGTSWGRGILVLGAQNVSITNNIIENIKQDGIKIISGDAQYRSQNIIVSGNTLHNTALYSGNAIGVYLVNNVEIINNTIKDPQNGSPISIGDWQSLNIAGNNIISTQNTFCRGIWAIEDNSIEGLLFTSPFNDLKIINNNFSQTNNGSNTQYNECIRINPNAANRWMQNNTFITGNTAYMASGSGGSTYIDIDYCTSLSKIVNNTCLPSCTVSTGGNNLVTPFTANNN